MNDDLFNVVAGMRLATYSEVLQSPQIIANRKAMRKASGEDSSSRSKPWYRNNHNSKRKFGGKRPDHKRPRTEEARKEFPVCVTCGKKHKGECFQ